MPANTRLMLIDGHALIHRAFHALPPLTTSSGELTNAVFGFANILLKELEELKPTHVLMAFDRPVPTFRHEAYADYKATRPPTPQPLVSQFQRVRQLAIAMQIPIYELDGFEADDVLGTLALQAEQRNVPAVIVTGDLDALQLVSGDVRVLTPARGISETMMYDLDAVRQRYGLEPEQLPDWKALVGDTSDNIPGVPGIGSKSASDLLGKFGSLEGLYEHLDQTTPRQRTALEENREQAFQSRELARIVRNAPVELDLIEERPTEIDRSAVINIFRELEFRTLIERIQAMYPAAARAARPVRPAQMSLFAESGQEPEGGGVAVLEAERQSPQTTTHVVRSLADLDAMVERLGGAGTFAFDTETTSSDPMQAKLVGLSFSADGREAWYVPLGHLDTESLPIEGVVEHLRALLEDQRIKKIAHNLKFDYQTLRRVGITLRGLDFDTMVAAYLVNPQGRGISLDALAIARFGVELTPISKLIGKGRDQLSMAEISVDEVAPYAGEDAAITYQLKDTLAPELGDRDIEHLFQAVEMPLVTVLAEMELTGVALDTGVLAEMSAEMTQTLERLEASIYDRVGRVFNINSPPQLGEVLFQDLELPSGRRTKTGYSTDSEVLEALRGKHPVVDEILEYRQLIKLKNTYVDALPSLLNLETGRVHTDFNQCAVATGRLSSSNPNLQNIPIRGELGRKIRRAFIPSRPDHVLLAADYSQIELRVMASMSGDERLVGAFQEGQDIHRATAADVFGVPLDSVTADQRRIAKVVNFGIMYGIGEQRLALETGITREEAREFIANYNRTYAGVKTFMDGLRRQAAFTGYVSTLLNRRRYLPDIHSNHPGVRSAAERAAINMPIQGTAADIIKIAMIRLHGRLNADYPDANMVLQVHDELVFDVPESQAMEIARIVRDEMSHAIELHVPIEVDVRVGHDWYDMEEVRFEPADVGL